MFGEMTLLGDSTYRRKLGALCALLCGACVLLGTVLVLLEPAPENVTATAGALAMSLLGAWFARRR